MYDRNSDIVRTRFLCSRSSELIRSSVENMPAGELAPHFIFDHSVMTLLTNISLVSANIARNLKPERYNWHLVRAMAKRLQFQLNANFAAVGAEQKGYDVIGCLMLVMGNKSDELDIEEGRRDLVETYGEDSVLVRGIDAALAVVNQAEEDMIASMPKELQAMFRIQRNLDEIIQLANRNKTDEIQPESMSR